MDEEDEVSDVKAETKTDVKESPVAGLEFEASQHAPSEFETSSEAANDQIDKDDQGVAVEVRSNPFPHRVRGDGVAVLPDEAPKMTKGGVLMPDTREATPRSGVVIALGPGKRHEDGFLETPDFKVGDRILYGNYAGTRIEVKVGGREVLLLRLEEVRVVLGKAR